MNELIMIFRQAVWRLTPIFSESNGIGRAVDDAMNPKKVKFFGLDVDPSLYTAFIVSGIIIAIVIVIRIFVIPKFQKRPKGFQMILESMVTFFDDASKELTHEFAGIVGPYTFGAATYIALATLIELIGLRPPMASINACFAMGFMTFLVLNYCGFKKKKGRRLLRFINPFTLLPDLAVPLSMSLRLFGSILSGFIIMELLYSIPQTSYIVPVIVAFITTIFHAVLQAYLFGTLTNTFVGEAIE